MWCRTFLDGKASETGKWRLEALAFRSA